MFKRVHVKTDGRKLYLYGTKPHRLLPLPEGERAPEAGPHLRWTPCGGVDCPYRSPGKRNFLALRGYCSLHSSGSEPSSPRFPFPSSRSPCSNWGQSLDTSGKDGMIWRS